MHPDTLQIMMYPLVHVWIPYTLEICTIIKIQKSCFYNIVYSAGYFVAQQLCPPFAFANILNCGRSSFLKYLNCVSAYTHTLGIH